MPGSSDRLKPSRDPHASRRVFVSYRRGDSAGQTGRLVHDLQTRFGAHTFFRDIDDLEPGVDFPEALNRALAQCEAMLVMIGPTWASVSDARGRRLEQPDDFVRLEVAAGLSRDGVVVIPVLVGGAVLPGPAELPDVLQSLHRRNAIEISDTRWEYDTHRLGDALIKQLQLKEQAPAATGGASALSPRALLALALPTVLLALLAVAAMFWRVPTAVAVDVATPRASFTVRGTKPQDLLNLSPQFSELRMEECRGLSFAAATFAPEGADGNAAPAAPATPASAQTPVSFACQDGSTISLQSPTGNGAMLGVLDAVQAQPGSTVVLDVYGEKTPVLTVDVSNPQSLDIPIHGDLRIVTDLTDLVTPPMPDATRATLRSGLSAYRATLPASNHYLHLESSARTVLVVTPAADSADSFFRTDTRLPVEGLEFVGEALGGEAAPPLNGTLRYAEYPSIPGLEFSGKFLVLGRASNMFISSLALAPGMLKLTVGGVIAQGAVGRADVETTDPSETTDVRLTAFQTVYHGPVWRQLAVAAAWLVATLAAWWASTRRPSSRPE